VNTERPRFPRRDFTLEARKGRVARGAERHGMREDRGSLHAHGGAPLEISTTRSGTPAMRCMRSGTPPARTARLSALRGRWSIGEDEAADLDLANQPRKVAVLARPGIRRRAVEGNEINCATSSRKVMPFIQRRTVDDALAAGDGCGGLGCGGCGRGREGRGETGYGKGEMQWTGHAFSVPDFSRPTPWLARERVSRRRGLASVRFNRRLTERVRCAGSLKLLAMTTSAPVFSSVSPEARRNRRAE